MMWLNAADKHVLPSNVPYNDLEWLTISEWHWTTQSDTEL